MKIKSFMIQYHDISAEFWMSYLMANMVGYPPLQPFL